MGDRISQVTDEDKQTPHPDRYLQHKRTASQHRSNNTRHHSKLILSYHRVTSSKKGGSTTTLRPPKPATPLQHTPLRHSSSPHVHRAKTKSPHRPLTAQALPAVDKLDKTPRYYTFPIQSSLSIQSPSQYGRQFQVPNMVF